MVRRDIKLQRIGAGGDFLNLTPASRERGEKIEKLAIVAQVAPTAGADNEVWIASEVRQNMSLDQSVSRDTRGRTIELNFGEENVVCRWSAGDRIILVWVSGDTDKLIEARGSFQNKTRSIHRIEPPEFTGR